jgi:proline dehydrogenase
MRHLLLLLSRQEWMKTAITRFPISRHVAERFVAGETIDHVVKVVRELNRNGMSATVDHLGEHVQNAAEARAAHREYDGLIDRLHEEKLDANVSVKLTEMGLDADERLCREAMEQLVRRAARHRSFVRIDMEASAYTQRTLDIFLDLRRSHENVGVVLQSYLYRTEKDLARALEAGGRVRLCKGAYDEPPDVAFPDKRDVDASFVRLTRTLLASGLYHGIATHDEAMIDATIAECRRYDIGASAFEFQMLYGVRRDLQEKLLREGWRMRVYVPYGVNWYAYLMRRMAERPANLLFVLRSLVRG